MCYIRINCSYGIIGSWLDVLGVRFIQNSLSKNVVSGLHNSTTCMLGPPEFIIKNIYTMLCYKEGKIVTKTLLSNEKLFTKIIFKKSIKMPSKKTSYPHYLCGPPC